MIKAVIFDCFGVLIQGPFDVMLNELDEQHPERADRVTEIINNQTISRVGVQRSRAQIANLFEMSPEEYASRLRMGQTKNVSLLEYIERLHENYKTSILSNVAKNGLSGLFTDDELNRCFDAVLTSGAIGYSKPHSRAYEIAANELKVRVDECLMIDDREDYCEAARGAGMKAINYITFAQMKRELNKMVEK